jgi:hypothetical protein
MTEPDYAQADHETAAKYDRLAAANGDLVARLLNLAAGWPEPYAAQLTGLVGAWLADYGRAGDRT